MPEVTVNIASHLFIRQSAPTTNYYGLGYMVLGKTGSGNQVDRILLRPIVYRGDDPEFEIPYGAVVNSAILHMRQVFSDFATATLLPFKAQRITALWDSSAVTWNNQPATTSSAEVSLSLSGNASGWREFNITALIKYAIENNLSFITEFTGIMLRQTNESTNDLRKQFSTAWSAYEYNPYIVVNYTLMPLKIAPVKGSISKQVLSMKIAPAKGSINKTVIGMKMAPTKGSINKTVF